MEENKLNLHTSKPPHTITTIADQVTHFYPPLEIKSSAHRIIILVEV